MNPEFQRAVLLVRYHLISFLIRFGPAFTAGVLSLWVGLLLSWVFARHWWTRKQRDLIHRHFRAGTPRKKVRKASKLEKKLRASGLQLGRHPVRTFREIQAISGLAVAVVTIFAGMPPLLVLVFAILGAYLPDYIVTQKVEARKRSIDNEIPEVYSRIASLMSTQPNVANIFLLTSEQLRVTNPDSLLAAELERTAKEIRSRGAVEALEALEKRAETPMLADLAFTMKLHAVSGGMFSRAIVAASDRARMVIKEYNKARAKTGQVKGLIIMLPALLTVIFLVSMKDQGFRDSYYSLQGQILLALSVIFMGIGYFFVQKMIEDVTK